MGRKIAFATIMVLTLNMPAMTAAQEDGPVDLPDCGRSVPISRTMLRGASFAGGPLRAGGAYLVATLGSPGRGTLLFVRDRASRWHGHAILGMSSTLGVFQSKRSSDVFAWAWNDAEGPGSSFTGIHASGGGGGIFCVDLPFPAELNQPAEFLSFDRFNIAPNGRGIVVGTADVERRNGTHHWFYRYDSRDFGRTWRPPARVSSMPAAPGAYRPVTGAAPAALVRSLRAQAH
jgi:hypothetical protein